MAHFTSNSSLRVIIGPFILGNPGQTWRQNGKMAKLVVFPRDLITGLPHVISIKQIQYGIKMSYAGVSFTYNQ